MDTLIKTMVWSFSAVVVFAYMVLPLLIKKQGKTLRDVRNLFAIIIASIVPHSRIMRIMYSTKGYVFPYVFLLAYTLLVYHYAGKWYAIATVIVGIPCIIDNHKLIKRVQFLLEYPQYMDAYI